ncbi:phasin family protein [Defluviimonas sp. WL0024]|uniref:Phasin family protein n=2 Tax=Albidovulum TaxID=205889 RepID=A0ABT3J8W9_9RHOB|nr:MULTISPECIES: phasin family protein [Defluviimonas]MCU9850475.1 phasin family protein [Defluviimonas sp. WL0024]MCW3784122.1 phasin family protein [Defluviimonas salinarum]
MDYKEIMKMFDPDRIAKMFNAEEFQSALKSAADQPFDMGELIASNQKNFEAMMAANRAAAEAYQDFYRKQMAIFEEVTSGAQEEIKKANKPGGTGTLDPKEVYRRAVEKALILMAEFASAARKAQDDAAAIMEARVKEAVREVRKG